MAARDLELLRGTLDVLILKTLSWGPAHGYAVASWIESVTGEALRIEEGSLYPALHRLERRGWVESEWGLSDNNRRAKYYELTEEGRRALQAESNSWSRFAEAVGLVLAARHGPHSVRPS
ncbi:MAG: PadR family transcriptional regulator [Gemmatimonadota bacterium]